MYLTDGKTVKGYKNIKLLEAQLGKDVFKTDSEKLPVLTIGKYNYLEREYPDMRQYYFGRTNRKVYDIDFNNFFIFSFLDYIISNNIKANPTVQKLKRAINLLNSKRTELKNTWFIAYSNDRFRCISEYYEFKGYGDGKITSRELLKEVKKFTDGYIDLKSAEEIIEHLCSKYDGWFYLINRYGFYKYKYLAGIGWIKRYNEQLWWNIMKHASMKLKETVRYIRENGATVYNIYIDSIQTDTNILKKFPELFEFFPAKLDKTGNSYGICLPPGYWLGKHRARWLEVDYKYYFDSYRNELINIENANLIYLYNFCKRVNHPLSEYIQYDKNSNTIQTFKIPKIEHFEFSWDFCQIKTEDIIYTV